ncbi:hypothetical protein [Paenibacillus senegalimassiliensis]|uniref:hypothetical protein n=1 Tax=Paenibacillus senegalimassiliensis TaxID=1737426 RepID=UPI00073E88A5|nr:hypothetical protein [Paenibacillus senegalimassiliensis]
MMLFILITGIILTVSLIIFTVKMGRLTFASPIIVDQLRPGQTVYLEEGDYGLWGETRGLRINRLMVENPLLVNSRMEKVTMYYSIAGTNTVNMIGVARRLLYTFSVPPGHFTFNIEDQPYSKISIPHANALAEVRYFIRKKTPFLFRIGFGVGIFASIASLIATVLLTVFSAVGMI